MNIDFKHKSQLKTIIKCLNQHLSLAYTLIIHYYCHLTAPTAQKA